LRGTAGAGFLTGVRGRISYSVCDSTTLSVPMARPTLPRIRRGRARGPAGEVVMPVEPRIAELSANGLTWIHVDEPGPLEAAALADRFGFHDLDVEDILSKRQRPKI